MQTTAHILMIRPVNFGFNAETAVNNAFQVTKDKEAQVKAEKEFDGFVSTLKANGVNVTVVNDTPTPYTPDSIFPNNWVSFHGDGKIFLYPMFAPNRRQERKPQVIEQVGKHFELTDTVDLSHYEKADQFLEGTGSMVLDRENKIAYACLSPRTNELVLKDFCARLHYTPITFHATDASGQAIYHTNVMMCVADKYVVICLASVANEDEKEKVIHEIKSSRKEIMDISLEQMNHFAGNMLQVQNNKGEKLLVMSSQALHSLTAEQIKKLESFNRIVHAPLDTIESNGGGSARCMMAEIFLQKK